MIREAVPTSGWAGTRASAGRRPPGVLRVDPSATLARLGLSTRALATDLTLAPSQRCELVVGAPSALRGELVRAARIREYKGWLGVSDEVARRVELPVPSLPAPGEIPDRAALEQAAFHYLYGDSTRVRAWEPVLDAHLAPYPLTVFAAGRVLIPAGASLVVSGGPAALVFDRLVLQDGGRLELLCPCNVHLGALDKRGLEA